MTGVSSKISSTDMGEMGVQSPDVQLILITGGPGTGKSSVAKALYCGLPERWALVNLDGLWSLRIAGASGDNWESYRQSVQLRAGVLQFYSSDGRPVIAEGIVQRDELREYQVATRTDAPPRRLVFVNLTCSTAESVRRMTSRDANYGRLTKPASDHERHFNGLTSRVDARGATSVEVEGKTIQEIVKAILDLTR